MRKRAIAAAGLAAAVALLALAAVRFASGLAYASYTRASDEALGPASRTSAAPKSEPSVKSLGMTAKGLRMAAAYPDLERRLLRAIRIGRLLPLASDPDQYAALARLDFDRAGAERPADPADPEAARLRDGFLDKAIAAGAERIRLVPSDSWAYFEMGRAYIYYNFPLLTYAEKGRLCLRRAAELNPAHEFLNLNVLFFHFSQWEGLAAPEREFALSRLEERLRVDPAFAAKLRRLWIERLAADDGLRAILASRPALWERVRGAFR